MSVPSCYNELQDCYLDTVNNYNHAHLLTRKHLVMPKSQVRLHEFLYIYILLVKTVPIDVTSSTGNKFVVGFPTSRGPTGAIQLVITNPESSAVSLQSSLQLI